MLPSATLCCCALPLAVLLAGCPGGGNDTPGPSAPPAQQSLTGKLAFPARPQVNYPPMVVDYIQSTLRDPATHEHAALAQAWDLVGRLADADDFRATILEHVQRAGNGPSLELVSAWLAVEPEEAVSWLSAQLDQGQPAYLTALAAHPELGRKVLDALTLGDLGRPTAEPILALLRTWEPAAASDAALLQQLAQSSEPRTQLRAIGYLCALGQASPKQVALLKEALRSDRINSLSAAAEACRICRDPALAAVLVNPAALIPLGDAPLAGGAQPESTGLYASYALAYLPGDQAKLLRTKLLDAADKRIRWQGRLGELLHGDIKPWYDAVLAADPGDPDMWLTIQPESVADPALLLTYKKTADAADPEVRLRTAQHLNRYGAAASDRLVGEILAKLIADEVPEVAAQAWHSAAVIRLPGRGNAAQLAVDDAAQPATVRLAAAFYVMRQAEPADAVQHAAAPEEQK